MQASENGHQGRNRRILVVDDNEATHQDFRKILTHRTSVLDDMEVLLFDEAPPVEAPNTFEIDSAFQGQDGFESVRHALMAGRPYDLAFVDLRMPPGWDGIETIAKIWEVDPQLQIVLCAAYLGQTPDEVFMKLGRSEGLAILAKPFEAAHVQELANSMADKCQSLRQTQLALQA
jgi:CheY-like chemotaxis protein